MKLMKVIAVTEFVNFIISSCDKSYQSDALTLLFLLLLLLVSLL